jgi:hypothetical protein
MAEVIDKQVLYQGRWVSRQHFAAFIYKKDGQRLVNNYDEFANLIASGLWYAEKKDIPELNKIEPENNVVDIKPKRVRKCRNQR